MRISSTEPLSLAKQINFKSCKVLTQKCQTKAKPKRDFVINPQNYNSDQFQHGKFGCSQKNVTNQPKPMVELRYMCPRGLTGPPAVTLTK